VTEGASRPALGGRAPREYPTHGTYATAATWPRCAPSGTRQAFTIELPPGRVWTPDSDPATRSCAPRRKRENRIGGHYFCIEGAAR